MRKIFTLCILGATALLSKKSSAQINEGFENGLAPLTADCWQFVSMMYASSPSSYVINGSHSMYSEPPVSADSLRIMRTPLLIVGSSIDISFVYRLSNNLTGLAVRLITVDLVDSAAKPVQNLTQISIANNATSNTTFSQTFAVNQPGLYRLSITLSGTGGGGSVRVSLDDLYESAIVFGCPGLAPLPVKLMGFQGNKNLDKVTLQWTVANNENNNKFEIERSTDGSTFSTVGIVMADEKVGNASYQFAENINYSNTVYYRLKMYDQAQSVSYSKVLIFKNTATIKSPLRILNNPTNDKVNFSYSSEANQVVDIKIYDMNGRMLMLKKMNVYQGSNVINFPLSNRINPGMYVLELNEGTSIQTAKFIRQ
jgi:hypothetical protein